MSSANTTENNVPMANPLTALVVYKDGGSEEITYSAIEIFSGVANDLFMFMQSDGSKRIVNIAGIKYMEEAAPLPEPEIIEPPMELNRKQKRAIKKISH